MKTFKVKTKQAAILLLMLVAGLYSCKSPKKLGKSIEKMEVKSDPDALEVNGDSVIVNVRGKFPPKSFSKNAVVKVQPILRFGDTSITLKPMALHGEKVKSDDAAKTINYKKGGSFTYNDKFEYSPEMKKSKLTIDFQVKVDSKYDELDQCVAGITDTAAPGTVTTSLTVKPTDDLYFKEAEQTQKASLRTLIFYYVLNEPTLRDTALKGPAIQQLRNFASQPNVKIDNIVFRSFASPDGEINRNHDLCEGRANSGMKAIKDELKKLGITQVYDNQFIRRPDKNEDWDGFKTLVTKSNMAQKQEILSIINSGANPEAKEKEFRKSSGWNYLKSDILPKLRRTEVLITGTFPSRTLEEIKAMNFDALTANELLFLAKNTTDREQRLKIFKYYMDKFPDDWSGKNNYAATLLQNGQYEEAHRMFADLHRQFPTNDSITSNLGVSYRFINKQYDAAKENLQTAQRDGVKENNNLGILYIKYGAYDKSTELFEKDRCDYNVALAYTLKNDFANAESKIKCTPGYKDNADMLYLYAIVGARSKDVEMMTTNLMQSIKLDPNMRQMAKEDLEFRKYWKNSQFLNALK